MIDSESIYLGRTCKTHTSLWGFHSDIEYLDFDVGDDKKSRPSGVHGFEPVSKSSSSRKVGCYKCDWTVVYRFGSRFAKPTS